LLENFPTLTPNDIETALESSPTLVTDATNGLSFPRLDCLNAIGNQPPVALCQNVSVPADEQCQADASIDNGSFDPEGDTVTLEQSPPGPYGLGSTSVVLTVTDTHGASDSCSATVTVVDTTPPELTAPGDLMIECASPSGTPVDIGLATASDACCVDVDVTNDAPALFPLGSTAVTWVATDCSGNVATQTQTITIVDTIPPEISVELDPDILWPPNHRMVAITAAVEASDICSVPTVVLESIVSSEPDDALGNGDGATVNDIQGTDYGTADVEFLLRAERAGGGTGRIYTTVYLAVDPSGNTAMASAVVSVARNVDPHVTPESVGQSDEAIQNFSSSGSVDTDLDLDPRGGTQGSRNGEERRSRPSTGRDAVRSESSDRTGSRR
jgi:hypothetical protein